MVGLIWVHGVNSDIQAWPCYEWIASAGLFSVRTSLWLNILDWKRMKSWLSMDLIETCSQTDLLLKVAPWIKSFSDDEKTFISHSFASLIPTTNFGFWFGRIHRIDEEGSLIGRYHHLRKCTNCWCCIGIVSRKSTVFLLRLRCSKNKRV